MALNGRAYLRSRFNGNNWPLAGGSVSCQQQSDAREEIENGLRNDISVREPRAGPYGL